MKIKKDPRINANIINFLYYMRLFFILIFISGFSYLIFLKMTKENGDIFFAVLGLVGFALFMSMAFLLILELYRKYIFMKPIYALNDAAKRVAEGDFTIRLSPYRKDGKKDEFEVLYEDFNAMVKELESTELMKTDFVSNLSHELKTPLSIINNYATILQDESLDETQRKEYLKRISQASLRMSILVTNILKMNKLEHQTIVLNKSNYNLSEQLSRCIISYDEILNVKELDLNLDLDENIMIYADEALMDIVFNNLLSNAIKFTDSKGLISIDMKKENNYIITSIHDNGCGISDNDIKHIFDKFYQADSSRATQGNGLGLPMVKKIVEMFNGKVQVESQINVGSTFKVILPIIEEISK